MIHRQRPLRKKFVQIQNVNVTLAAPDLEVAVIGAMPLIEVFDHIDLPAVEVKSSELLDTTFVHEGFDLNLHGALAVLWAERQ